MERSEVKIGGTVKFVSHNAKLYDDCIERSGDVAVIDKYPCRYEQDDSDYD